MGERYRALARSEGDLYADDEDIDAEEIDFYALCAEKCSNGGGCAAAPQSVDVRVTVAPGIFFCATHAAADLFEVTALKQQLSDEGLAAKDQIIAQRDDQITQLKAIREQLQARIPPPLIF